MDLTEIADRLEIQDVYARYVHAVDKADYATLEERVFTSDATFDYSQADGPVISWSELRAIRADGWKAIDSPKPEIYNLRDDPGETRNLYASQQALADRMIADAARMDREMAGGTAAAAAQPDRETLERLRSLGYVGAAAAPLKPGERGPDPKDHIAARRQYSQTVAAAIADTRG